MRITICPISDTVSEDVPEKQAEMEVSDESASISGNVAHAAADNKDEGTLVVAHIIVENLVLESPSVS